MIRIVLMAILMVFVSQARADGEPPAASDDDLLAALVDSALDRATAQPSAAESLIVLMGMREPWASRVLARVEQSQWLDSARLQASRGSGDSRKARRDTRSLMEAVALAQGSQGQIGSVALAPGLDHASVDFRHADTQWLMTSRDADLRAELLIETRGCMPEIAAFRRIEDLPARPLAQAVRFSRGLASVNVEGPTALRLRRGSCAGDSTGLTFSWSGRREGLPALPERRAVQADQVMIVSSDRRPVDPLHIATEVGSLYTVYAAPLDEVTDPALFRGDTDEIDDVQFKDDDGGWRLGSKLGPLLGTGQPQRVGLVRLDDGQGAIAVLVRSQKVPTYDLDAGAPVAVAARSPTWLRITVPAGRWNLRGAAASEEFDPAMRVVDADTLEDVAENDDVAEGTLDAEVRLVATAPRDVFVQLRSATDTDGAVRLLLASREREREKQTSQVVVRADGGSRRMDRM